MLNPGWGSRRWLQANSGRVWGCPFHPWRFYGIHEWNEVHDQVRAKRQNVNRNWPFPLLPRDRKNDKPKKYNCADYHSGGWWYKACTWAHLTGQLTTRREKIGQNKQIFFYNSGDRGDDTLESWKEVQMVLVPKQGMFDKTINHRAALSCKKLRRCECNNLDF